MLDFQGWNSLSKQKDINISQKWKLVLIASQESVQILLETETGCYGNFGDLSPASAL